MEAALVLTRLAQYLAVSAVGGSSLFFVLGLPPQARQGWPLRLVRAAAALGVVGVLGWLMAQAGDLGDSLGDAFKPASVWAVAADTTFGRAALARLALLLSALGLSLGSGLGRARWVALAGVGFAASASLAWTGHGAADEGLAGVAHLGADLIHLLSATVWIGALFGLSGLLVRAGWRRDAADVRVAADGLAAFSRIGVPVVLLVALSGLANSAFLVGLAALPSLLNGLYGRLLAAKLAIFLLMLGLAAANRYRHTERLAAGAPGSGLSPAIRSVAAETALGAMILAIVSLLGILEPAAHLPIQPALEARP